MQRITHSYHRSEVPSPEIWGRVTGPFEAVEDQGEAELVLASEVVAGLQHMPECELGEVGIGVGGELRQHDLRERRGLLWSVERQAPFLQREPVDVAVEGCVGVRSLLEGEAGVAEAAEDGVMVPQRRRAGGRAGLHQADRPAMPR